MIPTEIKDKAKLTVTQFQDSNRKLHCKAWWSEGKLLVRLYIFLLKKWGGCLIPPSLFLYCSKMVTIVSDQCLGLHAYVTLLVQNSEVKPKVATWPYILLTKGHGRSRFIERKVPIPNRSHVTIYIYRSITGIYGIDSKKITRDRNGQSQDKVF